MIEKKGLCVSGNLCEKCNSFDKKEFELAYMLHSTPGLGNKTLKKLYDYFGNCNEILNATEKEITRLITVKQWNSIEKMKNSWNIEAEYNDLYNRGIDFYPFFSETYPKRLKEIPDRPFALYCLGRLPDEERPTVSVIGARNSSEYGKYAARLFAEKLALSGVQIVSGMARGIDGIAQQAATDLGKDSYAILGSGVDVCYPSENRYLYEKLIQCGGVISEYSPGTLPKPQFFPPRNRIISGLSDAVLVIEARQKSGTLITVDMALEQGREVFALPGRINDNLSSGCNSLIRQGASIATGPEDIIQYLRKILMGRCEALRKCHVENEENIIDAENVGGTGDINNDMNERFSNIGIELTALQKIVFERLDMYPCTTTALYEKVIEKGLQISISEVMNVLVELCIMGIVGQNSGGFYIKG